MSSSNLTSPFFGVVVLDGPIYVTWFLSPVIFPFSSIVISAITWPFANVTLNVFTLFLKAKSCLALSTIPKSIFSILKSGLLNLSVVGSIVVVVVYSTLIPIVGVVESILSIVVAVLFVTSAISSSIFSLVL